MGEFVRVETDGAVGVIRLDRPKMNALNAQVQRELHEAADQVSADDSVRAVVIWGGDRVFAAGADIKEMEAMSYADMARHSGRLQSAFKALAAIPKPVIAAVTGYALGGGCELALTADFRVAAEDAKLGQPEILLGVIPGAGGTQRLPRLVGPSRAKDLIFSGRQVDAAEALAIGLVDRVVPAAEVYKTRRGVGRVVRRRARAGPEGGQGGRRPRAGGRPGHRPGDRAPPVLRHLRHPGPRRGHARLRRQGEAELLRPLNRWPGEGPRPESTAPLPYGPYELGDA